MRVSSIQFRNFRNIEELSLSGFEDMNVICGENAQGKTNLLEGIWLFTGAKSFRSSKDAAFVRFGCEKAALKLEFSAGGIENDAEITVSEHREALFNGGGLKSPSQLAGKFTAIVFSPADLSLVTGGPAVRRRFLDLAIGQLYPSYINILKSYTRAVTQRNRIIKDFKYDSSLSIMLDVFEAEIAENGEKITGFRKRYISLLGEFLPDVYGGLSGGREKLCTEYIPVCEGDIKEQLALSRKTDMLTGNTSVGPHRDELDFKINGISARAYGSQGQKRSIALSVKLAEAEVINKISGEYPVFLLDDVMSELDPARQNYILNHIKGLQSFLTCCDPSNISNLKKGKNFKREKRECNRVMYIHLGQETVVSSREVIGIFDLESTTISKHTRKFLEKAEKGGRVVNVSYELPKSFTVCCKPGGKADKVYISQISSSTLRKRSGFIESL